MTTRSFKLNVANYAKRRIKVKYCDAGPKKPLALTFKEQLLLPVTWVIHGTVSTSGFYEEASYQSYGIMRMF